MQFLTRCFDGTSSNESPTNCACACNNCCTGRHTTSACSYSAATNSCQRGICECCTSKGADCCASASCSKQSCTTGYRSNRRRGYECQATSCSRPGYDKKGFSGIFDNNINNTPSDIDSAADYITNKVKEPHDKTPS